MKVTQDLVLANTKQKPGKDEAKEHFLLRLTHINLEGKGITDIGALKQCRNLLNLYLYDNKLPSMSFVNFAPQLTHLYLQNNCIEKMESLEFLPRLQKLYLDHNRISRLEGLRNNKELEELHISKQDISEPLSIDEDSLNVVSNSLIALHCAGNKLKSACMFAILGRLQSLDLARNDLEEFSDVRMLLSGCFCLEEIKLEGNPLSRRMKYREKIIVMSSSLRQIDGKEIISSQREFLLRLEEKKDRERRANARRRTHSGSGDEGSFHGALHEVPSQRNSFTQGYVSGGAGSTLRKGGSKKVGNDGRQRAEADSNPFHIDAMPLDIRRR